ncbi:hypothetical protein [Virgibacillus dokdonensis]|uniref:Uncharacterized protein n=1 Tax=Virgibacillus dokdonensis TaxID=302167 RepID=A0ABU7VJI4_9BACI
MLKDQYICWPDKKGTFWFIYNILMKKIYRIRVENLSIDEQKSLFWTDNKLEKFNKKNKQIIEVLEKENFLKGNNDEYTEFNIPEINNDRKNLNVEKLNIIVDDGINFKKLSKKTELLKDYLPAEKVILEKKSNHSYSSQNNVTFFILSSFNPEKINHEISNYNNIVPVIISESDLVIGPKLHKEKCPCVDCLHIRLGSSSIDTIAFERQIDVARTEELFLYNKFINNNTSNIMDLICTLILKYVKEVLTGNKENQFIRYDLSGEKCYTKAFLTPPHINIINRKKLHSSNYLKVRNYI